MTEAIKNRFILEGIEIGRIEGEVRGEARGEARGELKGRIHDILTVLRAKFPDVPEKIVIKLNQRTDPTALESLLILAAQCDSIDAFADAMK